MSNHLISHGKTVFDLFNMINPNCYQAFIIQCIIENKKEEAIQYCNELSIAIEYYKWESTGKKSSYIDQLICESDFQKWQKIAIIYIISNNVELCKKVIENELDNDNEDSNRRLELAKRCKNSGKSPLDEFYNMFGFNSLI